MAALPAIPAKRYFTIGEVAELCDVKPYVLRYWEQEFSQLRPMKRRGNRRYYQHHEVLLVRRIRALLYEEGFTISGARNRLAGEPVPPAMHATHGAASPQATTAGDAALLRRQTADPPATAGGPGAPTLAPALSPAPPATGTGAHRPADAASLAQADILTATSNVKATSLAVDLPLNWAVIRQELQEIRDHLLHDHPFSY